MELKETVEMYYKDKSPSLDAINWNKNESEMADIYWEQGVSQFWFKH